MGNRIFFLTTAATSIKNGMKFLACVACIFGITHLQAAEYFPTPINFGTVTYNVAGGGFSTIFVTDSGTAGTAGSGRLFNRTGSAAGNYAVTNWETFEWRILINVKNPGASIHTISTPGCGTVLISNITMTGGQRI